MTTLSQLGTYLARASGHHERTLWFAALLRREAELGPDDVVVVGGSAIEIYTQGGYVSGDIDLCAPRSAIEPILKGWGFERPGREWAKLDLKLVVDIVGREPSGSTRLTRVVDTPFGPVRVGAVEDLILGRLALIKFWNEPNESVNVRLLVALPQLDWTYLETRARQEDVSDLLSSLRSEFRSKGGVPEGRRSGAKPAHRRS